MKQSTYDLILTHSQNRFNENGVESTSLNRIARELGISTGNLTYHFKRKRDLISKHISMFEQRMFDAAEQIPRVSTAKDFLETYIFVLKATWEYRFLFNCGTYLVENELLDQRGYQNLIEHVRERIVKQTQSILDEGNMLEISDPFDISTFIDCIQMQWLGWLNTNLLISRGKQLPTSADPKTSELFLESLKHCMLLTLPYLKPAFRKKVRNELKKYWQN